MVFTQHFCTCCGSEYIRHGGSAAAHAKYRCRSCGYQARFIPAANAKAVQYEQVDKLLSEWVTKRSIACLTGVSRMTVTKQAKKVQLPAPSLPRLRPKKAQKKRWKALELDEMWTFAGCKKRKVWLWLAVERGSRRIVAWIVGRRDAAMARRL